MSIYGTQLKSSDQKPRRLKVKITRNKKDNIYTLIFAREISVISKQVYEALISKFNWSQATVFGDVTERSLMPQKTINLTEKMTVKHNVSRNTYRIVAFTNDGTISATLPIEAALALIEFNHCTYIERVEEETAVYVKYYLKIDYEEV